MSSSSSRLKNAVTSFWNAVRPGGPDAPLCVVLLVMIALGVFLRVQNLGDPPAFKWDEHHFVENARNYLAARPDWNDHPPLSKLIIAGAMKVAGDTGAGWRLASLVFGLANIGLIAWSCFNVFRSRRAAWLAAAFVAADGFFIAYSRTALFDGIIVALGVAAMTTLLAGRAWWHALLAGVFIGATMSLKLSGLAFVPPTLAACFFSRRLRRWTPLFLAAIPLVYYTQYALALTLTGRPASPGDVITATREMIHHHLSFTEVHPYSSFWYTWFLPVRPFFLRREITADGSLRGLMILGNPLLWWASSAAVLASIAVVLRTGPRRLWNQLWGNSSAVGAPGVVPATPAGLFGRLALELRDSSSGLFWLLLAWAAPVAFWVPSLRDSFVYHYMPSYAFALALLAGLSDRLYVRYRLAVLIGVIAIALVTVFYAPLSAELPISPDAANARLFIRSWRTVP